jgi:arsenate reductase-like glutaredoxin family protein
VLKTNLKLNPLTAERIDRLSSQLSLTPEELIDELVDFYDLDKIDLITKKIHDLLTNHSAKFIQRGQVLGLYRVLATLKGLNYF